MMKAWMLVLVFFGALSPTALQAASWIQGRNEQEALIRRAERLQRQMEKMKTRYQKEGKKEYVALLDEGLRWMSESQLIRKMNETSLAISSKERRAIQAAKKVLGDIDKLLSILLDRRSIEDLEKETRGVEQQIQTLKRLQKKQNELKKAMKKVEEASKTKEETKITQDLMDLAQREREEARKNAARAGFLQRFLEQALDQVQKMEKENQSIQNQLAPNRQKNDLNLGQKATQLFRKTQQEIARLEAARSLEMAIKKLAQQTNTASKNPPPSLEKARRQMDRLQGSFPKALSKEMKRQWEALDSAMKQEGNPSSESRKMLRKFLDNFENESRTKRKNHGTQAENLSKEAQNLRAKAALKKAGKYLRKSAQDVSKKEALLQTGKALQELMDAIAAASPPTVGERAKALKRKAESLANGLQMNKERAGQLKQEVKNAIEALKDAVRDAEKLAKEDPNLNPRAPKNFSKAQTNQISKSLQEAKTSLQKAVNQLKQRVAGKAKQGEMDQANLQKKLKKIADGIQKAQAIGKLSPEQSQAAQKNLQQAKSEMEQARDNLKNASPSKASRNQNKAAQSLEKAARDLAKNRRPGEKAQAEMNRLAQKQEEVEQEILRLAQRINPRKNPKAKQALEEAAQAAKKAKRSMKAGQMQQSQQEQEKAAKKLEEARKNLENERDRYWRLRQEELLFRIGEEVGVLIGKQKELNRKTLDLAGEAANAERLPRRLRTRIRALGRAEKELEVRARFLAVNLKKEQTLVFTFVLESIADDLAEIGRIFSARRPRVDIFVQELQIEVLSRLKMLKDSLEEEQRKKKQQKNKNKPNQNKPNSNEGDQKPKLVPDVAELRMLKRLELATKHRIDTFLKLQNSLPGGLGELQTDALKRLALRHAKVSDIFRTFLKTRGLLKENKGPNGKAGEDGKKEKKN